MALKCALLKMQLSRLVERDWAALPNCQRSFICQMTGKPELIPGQKAGSGKLEIALALGADCGRGHGQFVRCVAGSTPGQEQPTQAPAESS